jgi:hypothetical protein
MTNDLLSLSLTDMPFNNRTSIRTSDAINALLQTGGEFEYNNTTNLIIGIVLLVISGIIFIGENNYMTINTNINYLNCNQDNCLLGVQFVVDGKTYTKEFNVDLNYVFPDNNQITITYQISNPNNNYIGNYDYNTLVYILSAIGIFFIGLWYYLSSRNSTSKKASLGIYTESESYDAS